MMERSLRMLKRLSTLALLLLLAGKVSAEDFPTVEDEVHRDYNMFRMSAGILATYKNSYDKPKGTKADKKTIHSFQ